MAKTTYGTNHGQFCDFQNIFNWGLVWVFRRRFNQSALRHGAGCKRCSLLFESCSVYVMVAEMVPGRW